MANGKAGAALLGAGVAATVTYIITSATKARAAPPPEGFDQETWNELINMMEAQAILNKDLIDAIGSLTVALGGEAIIGNPNGIDGGRIYCPTALEAKQLPDVPVPPNMEVLVKGLKNNTQDIYVAKTKQDAQNPNTSYPIIFNEFVTYKVDNVNRIWVSAEVAGEGIAWTVETRR